MNNFAIIGGGAAGVVAAVKLKNRIKDCNVTIFEKNDRLLKKVLRTGNGRCNLTNVSTLDVGQFSLHYNNPKFANSIILAFTPTQAMQFFEQLGVLLTEINGLVYPHSLQASSVVTVLLNEVFRRGINVELGYEVGDILLVKNGYKIGQAVFDGVIVALGSPAGLTAAQGYKLYKSLNVKLQPFLPSLTPLKCDKESIKGLGGVRVRARVQLIRNGDRVACEDGEVLFKDGGYLSGIAIFQLSAKYQYGDTVYIDLLPEYIAQQLFQLLLERAVRLGDISSKEFFTGMFAKNLGQLLLQVANINCDKCCDITAESIEKLVKIIKTYKVAINGTGSMSDAQVARGGVALSQINDKLESVVYKNLFFVGECVDISGDCGGYNLQWAFSSGAVAADNMKEYNA